MASYRTPYALYIGQRIREARESAGLSHATLAEAIGKTPESGRIHLIRLEQGRHLPQAGTLDAIAQATGRSVEWFLPAISEPREHRVRRYRVAKANAKVAA